MQKDSTMAVMCLCAVLKEKAFLFPVKLQNWFWIRSLACPGREVLYGGLHPPGTPQDPAGLGLGKLLERVQVLACIWRHGNSHHFVMSSQGFIKLCSEACDYRRI